MRVLHDTAAGDWLADRTGTPGSVGGVAAIGFAAYARILHPLTAHRFDHGAVDSWGMPPLVGSASWRWADVALRNGKAMHPLVQWARLTEYGGRTEWDDGWRVDESAEGWLDPVLLAALVPLLRGATTTDAVVGGVWDGWGGGPPSRTSIAVAHDGAPEEAERLLREAMMPLERVHRALVESGFDRVRSHGPLLHRLHRDFVLLEGALSELEDPDWGYGAGIGWTPGDRHPSLQLLWPGDRAWVLATEIDWDSTIVAGSRDLVDTVLADERFETFEVHRDATLTLGSDTVNSASPDVNRA